MTYGRHKLASCPPGRSAVEILNSGHAGYGGLMFDEKTGRSITVVQSGGFAEGPKFGREDERE